MTAPESSVRTPLMVPGIGWGDADWGINSRKKKAIDRTSISPRKNTHRVGVCATLEDYKGIGCQCYAPNNAGKLCKFTGGAGLRWARPMILRRRSGRQISADDAADIL